MMSFHEAPIRTGRGVVHALVMTPRHPVVAGRERLRELRLDTEPGAIDRQCIAEVERRRGRVQVLVFRGKSDDGASSWSFDATLTAAEEDEIGHRMVASMAPTRLAYLRAGVYVHVHSDFSPRDAEIFKRGTATAIAELERLLPLLTDARNKAQAQIDLWSLKHLSFYLTSSLTRVLDEILVDKLPLLEPRTAKVEKLLGDEALLRR
jgi:hypothetical protein